VLPQNMRTAFSIWKDVTLYLRSVEKDAGESYALSVMTLTDIRLASEAGSVGAVTKKLVVKLKNDFDAEADDEEAAKAKWAENEVAKRQALANDMKTKNELKVKEREALVGEVLGEIMKFKASDFELVQEQIMFETRRIEKDSGGADNIERVRNNEHILKNVRNIAKEVAHRVDLRKGLHSHFERVSSGKENELMEPETADDGWDEGEEDDEAGAIRGAFEMPTIGSLAALESIRMLSITPAMRAGGPASRQSISRRKTFNIGNAGGRGGGEDGGSRRNSNLASLGGGGKSPDNSNKFANRLTISGGAPGRGSGSSLALLAMAGRGGGGVGGAGSRRAMSFAMPR
jgi:hypothetical protein